MLETLPPVLQVSAHLNYPFFIKNSERVGGSVANANVSSIVCSGEGHPVTFALRNAWHGAAGSRVASRQYDGRSCHRECC